MRMKVWEGMGCRNRKAVDGLWASQWRTKFDSMIPTGNANTIAETRALLRILVLGRRQVEQGRTVSADEVFRRLRERASVLRAKRRG